MFDTVTQKRNFVTSSACGYCGKAVIAVPGQSQNAAGNDFRLHTAVLKNAAAIKQCTKPFATTGGAHAVALFTSNGTLLHISEDVGRHNAMDKLVGAMLQQHVLPLSHHIVLFSGRLGYELVQKAVAAGIPAIVSIGAPTSLAIAIAKENSIAVIGFMKETGFNVYNRIEEIIG